MDEPSKPTIYGILEFLSQEYNKPTTTADSKESLEVAMQCLETAFGINLQDTQYKSRKTLRELYQEAADGGTTASATAASATLSAAAEDSGASSVLGLDLGPQYDLPAESTEEQKTMAEDFKNKGNESMRNMNFSEALNHYTKAVELDGRNSVFFCNRAAAYIKLEQYDQALRDCQIAVRLQPNYARAFGRMGVTYSQQSKFVEAVLCYKRACQLEPENESYQGNLRYAQGLLMNQAQSATQEDPSNFQTFFNNPSLINMASQMLQDPSMQQMLQNLMGGLQAPQGAGTGDGGANPMENLLQMGQAIASQIRTANPQLAEQLGVGAAGNAFGMPGSGDPSDQTGNGNPPPGDFNPES